MPFRPAPFFALPLAVIASITASVSASALEAGPEPVPTVGGVSLPAHRGSMPVGSANYTVPAGAVFVDSARGNDSATGTKSAPFRTVTRALERTRSGGTVVLRAGEYHERVFVGQPVTIQAYPGEAVWFDGSRRITSWTPSSGGTWVTPFFIRFDRSTPGSADAFTGPQNPLAAWPEMVFVNGERLTQVASNPRGPQFAVDQDGDRLILGLDPAGKEVRAAALTQALVVGHPDVNLRGFGVRRFANSVSTYGAVYLARPRVLAENLVVEDVATTGMTLSGDGRTGAGRINQVTIRRAGLMGIHGHWADGGAVTNSVVTEANYERFNNTPTAAGMKIHATRGITIDNNRVSDTRDATGIWLDESVVGFSVTRNLLGGNGATGVSVELSSSGRIASNQVVGHEQGIVLYNTEKTLVANNTTGYNSRADIYMIQDWRRQAQGQTAGHDSRFPVGDPTNTWMLRDNTIKNNLLGADGDQKSDFQIYVMDRNTGQSADRMNIRLIGNAFTPRRTNNHPTAIGWGNADNSTTTNYNSPADFERAKRLSTSNGTLNTTEFGAGMEEARNLPVAVPLTADEAAPIGAPAGMRIIGSVTG